MPDHYTCIRCGAPFTAWPSNRRKYCGRTCSQAPKAAPISALIFRPDGAVGIPLYGRGGVKGYAIVDASDAEYVNQWRWCMDGSGYAVRNHPVSGERRERVYLHRDLLGLGRDGSMIGDHINRNRLDDRRSNLRIVRKSQDTQNLPSRGGTSRFRGVSWYSQRGKWIAYVTVAGNRHHLGYFTDEAEAGRVAREARARLMPFSTD